MRYTCKTAGAPGEEIRREAYHAIFKAHLDQEIIGQIRNATNGN